MIIPLRQTTSLGELVVAMFDEAAQHSMKPREVSRLATVAVVRLVRRNGGTIIPEPTRPVASLEADWPPASAWALRVPQAPAQMAFAPHSSRSATRSSRWTFLSDIGRQSARGRAELGA